MFIIHVLTKERTVQSQSEKTEKDKNKTKEEKRMSGPEDPVLSHPVPLRLRGYYQVISKSKRLARICVILIASNKSHIKMILKCLMNLKIEIGWIFKSKANESYCLYNSEPMA